jgi:hypothetical protein
MFQQALSRADKILALPHDSTALEEYLKATGWRQCAKGQRTTQYCGLTEEAVRQAADGALHSAITFVVHGSADFSDLDASLSSYFQVKVGEAIRQAKREALLERASYYETRGYLGTGPQLARELTEKAEEMK